MANYGMKVSRQGFDVKTCSDNQLLWSSAFKMPVVIASGRYDLTDPTTNQTIYTHNLGYVPVFFIVFRFTTGTLNTDFQVWDGNTKSGWTAALYCDSTHIFYNQNEFSQAVKISWFIFNTPLLTSYTAPIVDSTDDTQGGITTDYGFKVSNDGNDVKTAGLVDLASFSGSSLGSSSVRHQIIHKIGTGTAHNGTDESFSHGLGYSPMFLFYGLQTGVGWFCAQACYIVNAGPTVTEKIRTWADSTNINFRQDTGSDRDIAYAIFKDPLL